MPKLNVIAPGITSVQGLGFYGSQRYGIAPGGAMDRMALAEANALTGQPAGAAAIEIGPYPASFRVSGGGVRLAFSGASRDVLVDDIAMTFGTTLLVGDGQILTLRGARSGQFSYLSVQGGLQPSEVQQPERDEPTRARRSWVLAAGDQISVKAAAEGELAQKLRLQTRTTSPIRVVLGPQLDYFSDAALNSFLATPWIISHAANRMGYLLEGGRVALKKGFNIISDGTVTGNIQIAGNGQPLAILCDRGTVGGYPKIATIISADIGRFAQTPISESVIFAPVSVLEAQSVARDFAFALANVKSRVEPINHQVQISLAALYEGNLAGDAYDPYEWLPTRGRSDHKVIAS